MNCPNCGAKSQLSQVKVSSIEVWACGQCLGGWLDPKLAHGQARSADFELALDALQRRWGGAPDYSVVIQHEVRVCPRCASGLRREEFAVNSAVPCDRCPRGHGAWADFLDLKAMETYLRRIETKIPEYGRPDQGLVGWLKQALYRLFNP